MGQPSGVCSAISLCASPIGHDVQFTCAMQLRNSSSNPVCEGFNHDINLSVAEQLIAGKVTLRVYGCIGDDDNIDNNGYLDAHDFHCLALRSCVLEGKGDCSAARLQKYQHIMLSLWEEIAQLADFDKDGMISVDEFKQAVKNSCVGRKYQDFPQAMKAFIESNFRMIDINCDGVMGIEEYRYDCVQRMVVEDIKVIDDAYNSLLNDDDRKKGGLTLSRYQELFALFLGDVADDCPAKHLFGPLEL